MDISVIIVNYNTKKMLSDAIDSILHHTTDVTYEIIVVDNASSDGSVDYLLEKYPQVSTVALENNLGFGRANNIGLELATGKYILYLNSDTLLLNNALFAFYSFMEDAEELPVGVCGTVMLNRELYPTDSNGAFHTITAECRSFVSLLTSRFSLPIKLFNVQKRPLPLENKVAVDYVIGADMFLKRELAEKFRFEENIFMYAEEMELQYRLVKAGYCNMLINGPSIIHLEGGSSSTKREESLFKTEQMAKSLFFMIKKHHSFFYALMFRIVYCVTHLSIFLSSKYSKEFKLKFFRLICSRI